MSWTNNRLFYVMISVGEPHKPGPLEFKPNKSVYFMNKRVSCPNLEILQTKNNHSGTF